MYMAVFSDNIYNTIIKPLLKSAKCTCINERSAHVVITWVFLLIITGCRGKEMNSDNILSGTDLREVIRDLAVNAAESDRATVGIRYYIYLYGSMTQYLVTQKSEDVFGGTDSGICISPEKVSGHMGLYMTFYNNHMASFDERFENGDDAVYMMYSKRFSEILGDHNNPLNEELWRAIRADDRQGGKDKASE